MIDGPAGWAREIYLVQIISSLWLEFFCLFALNSRHWWLCASLSTYLGWGYRIKLLAKLLSNVILPLNSPTSSSWGFLPPILGNICYQTLIFVRLYEILSYPFISLTSHTKFIFLLTFWLLLLKIYCLYFFANFYYLSYWFVIPYVV